MSNLSEAAYLKASESLKSHWILKEEFKYIYNIHLIYETESEEKLYEFWTGTREKLTDDQLRNIARDIMDDLESKSFDYLCRFKSVEIIGFFENDVNYNSE